MDGKKRKKLTDEITETHSVTAHSNPEEMERREFFTKAGRIVAGTVGGFAWISLAKIDSVLAMDGSDPGSSAALKSVRRKVRNTLRKTLGDKEAFRVTLSSRHIDERNAEECDCLCSCTCTCSCNCGCDCGCACQCECACECNCNCNCGCNCDCEAILSQHVTFMEEGNEQSHTAENTGGGSQTQPFHVVVSSTREEEFGGSLVVDLQGGQTGTLDGGQEFPYETSVYDEVANFLYGMLDMEHQGAAVPDPNDTQPLGVKLWKPSPNPLKRQTRLRYDLPRGGRVFLGIYDIAGRCVAKLVDGVQLPGHHSVMWRGRDRWGRSVSSGVYCARLRALKETRTQKLFLMR